MSGRFIVGLLPGLKTWQWPSGLRQEVLSQGTDMMCLLSKYCFICCLWCSVLFVSLLLYIMQRQDKNYGGILMKLALSVQ